MIDKEVVDNLRAKRKIAKTEFPKRIGMSNTGYNQMWENNSIKVETLSKIAEVLEVPITYFFEPKPDQTGEHEPSYTTSLQEKLVSCMEKKAELYERLLASETEKLNMFKALLEQAKPE